MTDARSILTRRVALTAATRLGVLMLTATVTLTGCTTVDEPSRTSTVGSSSPEASVTGPDQVLQLQAEQARTMVDGLTEFAPGAEWIINLDSRSVCGTPTDEAWPAQWGYTKTTLAPDGTPTSALTDRLTKDGWRVTSRDDGSDAAAARTTAQRDGAVLTIRSTARGIVAIAASTACVNADGTLDTRPVS